MQVQEGIKKQQLLKKFFMGVHPIIQHFIDKLRMRETISAYVGSDSRQKVDVENILCILIHNILTTRSPLYEVQDWLRPIDTELMDISHADIKYVYDERIGRALEKFYACRYSDIYFRLALRAIKLFELDTTQIHQDTTTITFTGKYADWSAKENLTHGHNKDHRPDLKQLVLGISVTADGAVPLIHQIYDGNQTDDKVHINNHKRLQKLLNCSDFIYVADCKLCTEENLNKINHWSGRFVSVMPRTWKEGATFRRRVMNDEVEWKYIHSRKNNREPKKKTDKYYVAKGKFSTVHGYHLYWIHSTQKAEQDVETRIRRLRKCLSELKELQQKLNKYSLKTKEQIRDRVENFIKKNNCGNLIDYAIEEHMEVYTKYNAIGRPNKSTPKKKIKKTIYTITFNTNKDRIALQAKTDGIFPLITNLTPTQYKSVDVLKIYKYQPFIEKRYSQIKTYQEIAPAYLKKDTRVLGLLHMHVMALMVATLIERQLRNAMKQKGIKALPIYPEDRDCTSPTMYDLVRLFRNVERYEVKTMEDNVSIFPAQLTKAQRLVLELLDVPIKYYQ